MEQLSKKKTEQAWGYHVISTDTITYRLAHFRRKDTGNNLRDYYLTTPNQRRDENGTSTSCWK